MSFDFGTANENQRKAIQTTEGPVLIIAGPGTGKTFTLVKRAVYLITEKHIKPENIMIATFTEKAAKEIVTRITNELIKLNINVNVNELYIGTLHSICLRLIKENLEYTRLKKNYRLLDDFEQKYFVFQNINYCIPANQVAHYTSPIEMNFSLAQTFPRCIQNTAFIIFHTLIQEIHPHLILHN